MWPRPPAAAAFAAVCAATALLVVLQRSHPFSQSRSSHPFSHSDTITIGGTSGCAPHTDVWQTSIDSFMSSWSSVPRNSLDFSGFVHAMREVPEGTIDIALAVQAGALWILRPAPLPLVSRHPWIGGLLAQLHRAAPSLPDAYFFVTTSDWPLARKDGPPHWSQLLTLGPSTTTKHYDIPIPNGVP